MPSAHGIPLSALLSSGICSLSIWLNFPFQIYTFPYPLHMLAVTWLRYITNFIYLHYINDFEHLLCKGCNMEPDVVLLSFTTLRYFLLPLQYLNISSWEFYIYLFVELHIPALSIWYSLPYGHLNPGFKQHRLYIISRPFRLHFLSEWYNFSSCTNLL